MNQATLDVMKSSSVVEAEVGSPPPPLNAAERIVVTNQSKCWYEIRHIQIRSSRGKQQLAPFGDHHPFFPYSNKRHAEQIV